MSTYLLKVDETYRADTESEAANIIAEAKKQEGFTLAKYSSVKRERKQKGEVIDEWMRVTLTKVFDDEKEPIGGTTIQYDIDGGNY